MEIQKAILKICMRKGFLLDREMLESLSVLDEGSAEKLIEVLDNLKTGERVITKSLFSKNFEKMRHVLVNGKTKTVIENLFVNLGYSRTELEVREEAFVGEGAEKKVVGGVGMVKILSSPAFPAKKVVVGDFVKYFRLRYEEIKDILQQRDLENLASIRKISDQRENYTIIVAVLNKRITKNKNLILEVEDMTGTARVLINKNREDVFETAKDLLSDDIVAIQVSGNSEWLFGNKVIFPDCFLQEKRRSDFDEWVAFTADFHVGSKMFLEKNVLKFIKWLNGEEGSEEQKDLAKKVKYLFLIGDNIDGVGHHPQQEPLLNIKDLFGQYKKFSELLKLIRKDIQIIICPGQHDGVWVGEPQPILSEVWAPELYKMKNVFLVSNPALVEIDGGFKILMYHGASINRIIDEITDIRVNHGHNNPTRVVKEMLKRRHLAPMHGSVDYIPCEKQDPLVISQIPDIVATADQHRAEVGFYNNILLIASSCWQKITPFEEKVGNVPDPGKVPLFNLKSREIKIVDFSDEEVAEQEIAPLGVPSDEGKETNEGEVAPVGVPPSTRTSEEVPSAEGMVKE